MRSFDDARLLQSQRYSIVRENYRNGKPTGEQKIATDLPAAPSNAGPKSFPNYNKVANEAIRVVGNAKYFAGQRDDAFFIDLGTAFDNINIRVLTGSTGGGTDTQADTSIQTITMQVPESDVTRDRKPVVRARCRQRHRRRVGIDGSAQAAGHQRPLRQRTRERAAAGCRSRAWARR